MCKYRQIRLRSQRTIEYGCDLHCLERKLFNCRLYFTKSTVGFVGEGYGGLIAICRYSTAVSYERPTVKINLAFCYIYTSFKDNDIKSIYNDFLRLIITNRVFF